MMKTILFQGDSITDCNRGRDWDHNETGVGYATMVTGVLGAAEPYRYQFFNRGISGNRIVDVYAHIKSDIINLKPDYMSLLIGVNDVWHEIEYQNGISAEKFEFLYSLLIEEVRAALPELKIMIFEPFVLPGDATDPADKPEKYALFRKETQLRAQVAKRIAQKYDLLFVPLQKIFDEANADAPAPGYWLWDGVHPTAAGHDLIKREWLKAFELLK